MSNVWKAVLDENSTVSLKFKTKEDFIKSINTKELTREISLNSRIQHAQQPEYLSIDTAIVTKDIETTKEVIDKIISEYHRLERSVKSIISCINRGMSAKLGDFDVSYFDLATYIILDYMDEEDFITLLKSDPNKYAYKLNELGVYFK